MLRAWKAYAYVPVLSCDCDATGTRASRSYVLLTQRWTMRRADASRTGPSAAIARPGLCNRLTRARLITLHDRCYSRPVVRPITQRRAGIGETQHPDSQPNRSQIRPEIQALRAIAVSAVVLNHLWPSSLRGGFLGVDVFFVISGFLITAHLAREANETGTIRFGQFWARRARRLLPASFLVLGAAAAGVVAFVPQPQWPSVMQQIRAAASYLLNWQLISQRTNYFTSSQSPSPVTHYWSLSVEEQFYLAWPLLIVASAVLTRRFRPRFTAVCSAVLAVVTAGSFAYSVALTSGDPAPAYFSTFSRAWEFGLGAMLAVLTRRVTPSVPTATVLAWSGWGGLALSLVVIDESTPFPGVAALLPTVATGLVIAAGNPAHRFAPGAVVRIRAIQYLGDTSYGIYLWHWPLVILVPYALGREIGWIWRTAILFASVLLAAMVKRLVEDPVRGARILVRAPARRTFALVAMSMALLVGTSTWVNASVGRSIDDVKSQLATLAKGGPCVGAAALANNARCPNPFTLLIPQSVLITPEIAGNPVDRGSSCQQDPFKTEVVSCWFGADAADARLTIALTGDSHAGHYVQALNKLASAHHWRIEMFLHSSCPTTVSTDIAPSWQPTIGPPCHAWNDKVVSEIAARPEVDMVISSSISRYYRRYSGEKVISTDTSDAYVRAWRTWTNAGKRVLVIGDVPDMQLGDIPTCVSKAGTHDPCTQLASRALGPDPMVTAFDKARDPLISLFDPTRYICDRQLCHSVVGGILVFGDAAHLSDTFSATLAPYLYGAMNLKPDER